MIDRKNKLIVVMSIFVLLLLLIYLLFLQMTNNGNLSNSKWNVKITGITENYTGTANEQSNSSYTDTTATFNTKLSEYGDSKTYTVSIENKGSVDAKLDNVQFTSPDYKETPIIYSIESEPDSVLVSGQSTKIVVKAFFDDKLIAKQIESLSPEEKLKTVSLKIKYKKIKKK